VTLHEKRVPAADLLAQARALLLQADRATDLRTALLAVREARAHVEELSVTMRQVAAVEDAAQDTQRPQDAA
jgi:hypothetical protein